MKTRACLLFLLGLSALVPAARAGLDLSVVAEIRLGKALPPPPPEVEIIEAPVQKGPPPWAPAHGFRRNREYYFYPGANVYFRPADRTWFYLDGREWRVGVSLPTSIRVDFGRSVSLEMESDRPFEFHQSVAQYYPSDYFTKKVKIKGASGKNQVKIQQGKPAKEKNVDAGSGSGKGKDRGGKGKGKG